MSVLAANNPTLTVTQRRALQVEAQREAGFRVFDGTRGSLSHGVPASVLNPVIEYYKSLHYSPSGYGKDTFGERKYREMASEALKKIYPQLDIHFSQVAFMVGAQSALINIMRAHMKTSELDCSFVIPRPGYANYRACHNEARSSAEKPNANIVDFPLPQDGTVTAEGLEKTLSNVPENRQLVVLLTTPNNPQSQIMRSEEVNKIIAVCMKYNAKVIMDASFLGLDFEVGSPERFKAALYNIYTAEAVEYVQNHVSIINSGSKCAAMPGLRPCTLTLPKNSPELVGAVRYYSSITVANSPIPDQIAMAYWLKTVVEEPQVTENISNYYLGNMENAAKALDNLGLGYIRPQGGMFLTTDFKPLCGLNLPEDMAKTVGKPQLETDGDVFNLLIGTAHSDRREKVAMMLASDFGFEPEEMKMRFCYGMPPDEICGAMRVLTNIVNRVRAHNLETYVYVPEPIKLPQTYNSICYKNPPKTDIAYSSASVWSRDVEARAAAGRW